MQFNIRDATILLGIGSTTVGVFLVFGAGWALVASGSLLIGLALISG